MVERPEIPENVMNLISSQTLLVGQCASAATETRDAVRLLVQGQGQHEAAIAEKLISGFTEAIEGVVPEFARTADTIAAAQAAGIADLIKALDHLASEVREQRRALDAMAMIITARVEPADEARPN